MAYPTPDTDPNQSFRCVQVYIPTSVEDVFFSVLMGQMGELSNGWYWIPSGTMSPDEAGELWSQAVALTNADGIGCDEMDCNDVQNCLGSTEGIKSSTDAVLGLTSEVQNAKLGKGINTLDTCSEDHVWGATNQLVDFLVDSCIDTLELIEASTNIAEIFANWLGFFIPDSVLEALGNYLSWLQDSIAESFEAQLTTALVNEYKCDLFCLYVENCNQLSSYEVAQYFRGRLSAVDVLDTLSNLIDFLILGTWTGTQICDAMMLGMVGLMNTVVDPVVQIVIPDLYTLDRIFAWGARNPSDEWEVLCDDCPSLVDGAVEWDFTVNDGGWLFANDRGAYSSSVGFITDEGSGQTGCWIYKLLPSNCVITGIETYWTADNGVWRSGAIGRDNISSSAGQVVMYDVTGLTFGGQNCQLLGGVDRNNLMVFINTTNNALDATITKVKVKYAGEKPTGYTEDTGVTLSCD